ncbi:MAG TPA: SDR family NAD(P)-dependent oxidoreductase [Verrucomicrobiota bacterium]|nr:SDR family NAD(P)-dependent oxidoreductase [Verrucomicrobiota bacterium]
MKISAEQVKAFGRLSHDRNPLHTDAAYARTTQFGKPVVYGMCAVVLGIAKWADGRRFQLVSLKGQFGKPLFEGEEYDCRISEAGNQVKVQFIKGAVVQSGFTFSWVEWNPAVTNGKHFDPRASFAPRATAVDAAIQSALPQWQARTFNYSMTLSDSQSLLALGLADGQMPDNQLNAILGSSYFIGMELPGRQALYSGFEFEFEPAAANENDFCFEVTTTKHDARLNRVAISGHGTGIKTFALSAFQRPRPVNYSMSDVEAGVGCSEVLKGRTVFISGATRGFGAVLAKALALQGAELMLNYRTNRDEAEALASELRERNPRVVLCAGDVSRAEDCRNISAEILGNNTKIDILISNAFPQIGAKSFLEQDSVEFMQFLNQSVAATVTLFRELIPLMNKGGVVVLVSTIFTTEPKPQFAHYVAAKSALEGLMRVLALEFRDLKFLIARPPRMLTDQTNLAFDLTPPLTAVEVARRFLTALNNTAATGNLFEINLAEQTADK